MESKKRIMDLHKRISELLSQRHIWCENPLSQQIFQAIDAITKDEIILNNVILLQSESLRVIKDERGSIKNDKNLVYLNKLPHKIKKKLKKSLMNSLKGCIRCRRKYFELKEMCLRGDNAFLDELEVYRLCKELKKGNELAFVEILSFNWVCLKNKIVRKKFYSKIESVLTSGSMQKNVTFSLVLCLMDVATNERAKKNLRFLYKFRKFYLHSTESEWKYILEILKHKVNRTIRGGEDIQPFLEFLYIFFMLPGTYFTDQGLNDILILENFIPPKDRLLYYFVCLLALQRSKNSTKIRPIIHKVMKNDAFRNQISRFTPVKHREDPFEICGTTIFFQTFHVFLKNTKFEKLVHFLETVDNEYFTQKFYAAVIEKDFLVSSDLEKILKSKIGQDFITRALIMRHGDNSEFSASCKNVVEKSTDVTVSILYRYFFLIRMFNDYMHNYAINFENIHKIVVKNKENNEYFDLATILKSFFEFNLKNRNSILFSQMNISKKTNHSKTDISHMSDARMFFIENENPEQIFSCFDFDMFKIFQNIQKGECFEPSVPILNVFSESMAKNSPENDLHKFFIQKIVEITYFCTAIDNLTNDVYFILKNWCGALMQAVDTYEDTNCRLFNVCELSRFLEFIFYGVEKVSEKSIQISKVLKKSQDLLLGYDLCDRKHGNRIRNIFEACQEYTNSSKTQEVVFSEIVQGFSVNGKYHGPFDYRKYKLKSLSANEFSDIVDFFKETNRFILSDQESSQKAFHGVEKVHDIFKSFQSTILVIMKFLGKIPDTNSDNKLYYSITVMKLQLESDYYNIQRILKKILGCYINYKTVPNFIGDFFHQIKMNLVKPDIIYSLLPFLFIYKEAYDCIRSILQTQGRLINWKTATRAILYIEKMHCVDDRLNSIKETLYEIINMEYNKDNQKMFSFQKALEKIKSDQSKRKKEPFIMYEDLNRFELTSGEISNEILCKKKQRGVKRGERATKTLISNQNQAKEDKSFEFSSNSTSSNNITKFNGLDKQYNTYESSKPSQMNIDANLGSIDIHSQTSKMFTDENQDSKIRCVMGLHPKNNSENILSNLELAQAVNIEQNLNIQDRHPFAKYTKTTEKRFSKNPKKKSGALFKNYLLVPEKADNLFDVEKKHGIPAESVNRGEMQLNSNNQNDISVDDYVKNSDTKMVFSDNQLDKYKQENDLDSLLIDKPPFKEKNFDLPSNNLKDNVNDTLNCDFNDKVSHKKENLPCFFKMSKNNSETTLNSLSIKKSTYNKGNSHVFSREIEKNTNDALDGSVVKEDPVIPTQNNLMSMMHNKSSKNAFTPPIIEQHTSEQEIQKKIDMSSHVSDPNSLNNSLSNAWNNLNSLKTIDMQFSNNSVDIKSFKSSYVSAKNEDKDMAVDFNNQCEDKKGMFASKNSVAANTSPQGSYFQNKSKNSINKQALEKIRDSTAKIDEDSDNGNEINLFLKKNKHALNLKQYKHLFKKDLTFTSPQRENNSKQDICDSTSKNLTETFKNAEVLEDNKLSSQNHSNTMKISKNAEVLDDKKLSNQNQSNKMKISKNTEVLEDKKLSSQNQSNKMKISKNTEVLEDKKLSSQNHLNAMKISKNTEVLEDKKLSNQNSLNTIKIPKNNQLFDETDSGIENYLITPQNLEKNISEENIANTNFEVFQVNQKLLNTDGALDFNKTTLNFHENINNGSSFLTKHNQNIFNKNIVSSQDLQNKLPLNDKLISVSGSNNISSGLFSEPNLCLKKPLIKSNAEFSNISHKNHVDLKGVHYNPSEMEDYENKRQKIFDSNLKIQKDENQKNQFDNTLERKENSLEIALSKEDSIKSTKSLDKQCKNDNKIEYTRPRSVNSSFLLSSTSKKGIFRLKGIVIPSRTSQLKNVHENSFSSRIRASKMSKNELKRDKNINTTKNQQMEDKFSNTTDSKEKTQKSSDFKTIENQQMEDKFSNITNSKPKTPHISDFKTIENQQMKDKFSNITDSKPKTPNISDFKTIDNPNLTHLNKKKQNILDFKSIESSNITHLNEKMEGGLNISNSDQKIDKENSFRLPSSLHKTSTENNSDISFNKTELDIDKISIISHKKTTPNYKISVENNGLSEIKTEKGISLPIEENNKKNNLKLREIITKTDLNHEDSKNILYEYSKPVISSKTNKLLAETNTNKILEHKTHKGHTFEPRRPISKTSNGFTAVNNAISGSKEFLVINSDDNFVNNTTFASQKLLSSNIYTEKGIRKTSNSSKQSFLKTSQNKGEQEKHITDTFDGFKMKNKPIKEIPGLKSSGNSIINAYRKHPCNQKSAQKEIPGLSDSRSNSVQDKIYLKMEDIQNKTKPIYSEERDQQGIFDFTRILEKEGTENNKLGRFAMDHEKGGFKDNNCSKSVNFDGKSVLNCESFTPTLNFEENYTVGIDKSKNALSCDKKDTKLHHSPSNEDIVLIKTNTVDFNKERDDSFQVHNDLQKSSYYVPRSLSQKADMCEIPAIFKKSGDLTDYEDKKDSNKEDHINKSSQNYLNSFSAKNFDVFSFEDKNVFKSTDNFIDEKVFETQNNLNKTNVFESINNHLHSNLNKKKFFGKKSQTSGLNKSLLINSHSNDRPKNEYKNGTKANLHASECTQDKQKIDFKKKADKFLYGSECTQDKQKIDFEKKADEFLYGSECTQDKKEVDFKKKADKFLYGSECTQDKKEIDFEKKTDEFLHGSECIQDKKENLKKDYKNSKNENLHSSKCIQENLKTENLHGFKYSLPENEDFEKKTDEFLYDFESSFDKNNKSSEKNDVQKMDDFSPFNNLKTSLFRKFSLIKPVRSKSVFSQLNEAKFSQNTSIDETSFDENMNVTKKRRCFLIESESSEQILFKNYKENQIVLDSENNQNDDIVQLKNSIETLGHKKNEISADGFSRSDSKHITEVFRPDTIEKNTDEHLDAFDLQSRVNINAPMCSYQKNTALYDSETSKYSFIDSEKKLGNKNNHHMLKPSSFLVNGDIRKNQPYYRNEIPANTFKSSITPAMINQPLMRPKSSVNIFLEPEYVKKITDFDRIDRSLNHLSLESKKSLFLNNSMENNPLVVSKHPLDDYLMGAHKKTIQSGQVSLVEQLNRNITNINKGISTVVKGESGIKQDFQNEYTASMANNSRKVDNRLKTAFQNEDGGPGAHNSTKYDFLAQNHRQNSFMNLQSAILNKKAMEFRDNSSPYTHINNLCNDPTANYPNNATKDAGNLNLIRPKPGNGTNINGVNSNLDILFTNVLSLTRSNISINDSFPKYIFANIEVYITLFSKLIAYEILANINQSMLEPPELSFEAIITDVECSPAFSYIIVSTNTCNRITTGDFIKINFQKSSIHGIIKFFAIYKTTYLLTIIIDPKSEVPNIDSRIKISVQTSLSTQIREFQAIFTIQLSPFKNIILGNSGKIKYQLPTIEQIYNIKQSLNVNHWQATAIGVCRHPKNRIVLIQGPPGTGKSTTIVALVKSILSQAGPLQDKNYRLPKLLICAPSNNATDLIAKRLLKTILNINTARGFPYLVRVGILEAIDQDLHEVTLEGWARRLERRRDDTENRPDDILHFQMQNGGSRVFNKEENQPNSTNMPECGNKKPSKDIGKQQGPSTTQKNTRKYSIEDSRFQEKTIHNLKPEELKQRKKLIINDANIICATLSSSAMEICSDKALDFDYVIIDEASQAIEPSILIPLRHNIGKLILIGDTKQLAPTVISDSKQLKISMFDRISNWADQIMLRIQYRMCPELVELPNNLFYQNKLQTDTKISLRKNPFQEFVRPFSFINILGKEIVTKCCSYINVEEAIAISHFIMFLSKKNMISKSIAIITPYKKQVKQIPYQFQLIYRQRFPQDITINTVDAFQGQEKDMVIISTVRTSKIGFLSDLKRLNVSLTRSRFALLIFGHARFLQNDPFWKKIVGFYRENNALHEVLDFFSNISKKM